MKNFLIFPCLLFLLLEPTSSSKILFLLPIASKSHVHVFEPLIRALGARGHEIINFTPQELKNVPKNVKQINVLPVSQIFKDMQNPFDMRKAGKLAAMTNMSTEYLDNACKIVLDSAPLKEMMAKEQFDLVIVDILLNYCMLGILPHFKAPYIFLSTMVAPSHVMDPTGNRLPPSFIPSPFFEYSDRMTFSERVINWMFCLFMDVAAQWYLKGVEDIYKEKLGIDVGVVEITKNVSMILSNTHFTMTYPRPYLPDVVDVGGMHTVPAGPLPKDLEEFISGAEHGCIFFSLGSIAQGKDMPEEYRKVFINVFSKLKQRVLWKWESDSMPDKPSNVKLIQWAPQQDILGHKNIKLFMTHGGLLSIQEAVYHGVPLLGIPLFADQDLNAKQAQKAGFGVTVEILDMDEQSLEANLKEILENSKYAEKIKELSLVWRDQPMKPLDTAVWWSEYVIRQKGAVHLRSAARDLNFFQYHSLDVIAFVLTLILFVLYVVKCFIKFLWKKLCGGKQQSNVASIKKTN